MMKEHIDNLIKKARKENSSSLLVYTLIKSELVNNEHSKHPLSDIDVLRKMIKEREKAETSYLENGRRDLANKERLEIMEIEKLLPKEPPLAVIYEAIKNAISALGYTPTIKDTPIIISIINTKYPTAQKSTIVKTFKTLLNHVS